MRMVEALVQAGRLHDLAVLPQEDHRIDGANELYMGKLAIAYFKEHLQEPTGLTRP
jgi:dipeptidyl aminopeptidase/acylaminoacyl peptidase